jgi:hypothetical protein
MKIVFVSRNYVLLLYIVKNDYTKILYFRNIKSHTSLRGPTASGASVDPTSLAYSSAMLVLHNVGN